MTLRKHGIKILGLSLLAVTALMAISASAAQAGEFKKLGQTFTALNITSELFEGTIGLGKLLVPSIGLTIHCTSGHVHGDALKGGEVHVLILFLGCTAEGPKCTITSEEEGTGEVGSIHAEGSGQLVLNGGKHYVTATSANFATVYMSGSKCTLPEENPVHGTGAVLLSGALTSQVNQPVAGLSAAEETALGVSLEFGTHPAVICNVTPGSVALTSGEPWSAE